MPALIRAMLAVMFAATTRSRTGRRVLLADADPEPGAVRATLAPWRLEVVVETTVPADAKQAQMIGETQTARFVVWRVRGELVVYDRDRGAVEQRAAPVGRLDPASAAAAALTVKTLMRLPPPDQVAEAPVPAEPADRVAVVTPEANDGVELRVQAGVATRMTRGEQNDSAGARTSRCS
ncbi:MAG: hypothetical protein WKG01_17065 [Kofleriaceae bacterium]